MSSRNRNCSPQFRPITDRDGRVNCPRLIYPTLTVLLCCFQVGINLKKLISVGRWSTETGSDNEYCHKRNSPNPLPNPVDVTPETCLPTLQSEQYMVRPHYDNHYKTQLKSEYLARMVHPDNMNFQDYPDRPDFDEKHHMNDKYLFPYTGKLIL